MGNSFGSPAGWLGSPAGVDASEILCEKQPTMKVGLVGGTPKKTTAWPKQLSLVVYEA